MAARLVDEGLTRRLTHFALFFSSEVEGRGGAGTGK
jgi:hypothetical protein